MALESGDSRHRRVAVTHAGSRVSEAPSAEGVKQGPTRSRRQVTGAAPRSRGRGAGGRLGVFSPSPVRHGSLQDRVIERGLG